MQIIWLRLKLLIRNAVTVFIVETGFANIHQYGYGIRDSLFSEIAHTLIAWPPVRPLWGVHDYLSY